MDTKTETVEKRDRSIFVDPALHHELRLLAAKKGVSIKHIVETLVREGMDKRQAA